MDDQFTCVAPYSLDQEKQLLRRFVEALLSAEQELDAADPQEWNEVLLQACRRQRSRRHSRQLVGVAAC